jgi:hypothetical protein
MADETNTQCSKRTEDWNKLPGRISRRTSSAYNGVSTKPRARTIPSASTTCNG